MPGSGGKTLLGVGEIAVARVAGARHARFATGDAGAVGSAEGCAGDEEMVAQSWAV